MGAHKYDEHGTSDCHYGCGCWCGNTNSGGPDGIDPTGDCPKNPDNHPDGCEICEDADEIGFAKLSHFELGKHYGRWLQKGKEAIISGTARYIQAHASDPEAIKKICAGIIESTEKE